MLTDLAGASLAQLGEAVLTVTPPLGGADEQPDFVEARSLQGMSLAFHIVTVCFAVSSFTTIAETRIASGSTYCVLLAS